MPALHLTDKDFSFLMNLLSYIMQRNNRVISIKRKQYRKLQEIFGYMVDVR